jgi:polyisoprenoid-binding protein YceI
VIDPENYPWMTFTSTTVVRTGPTTFKVTGDKYLPIVSDATTITISAEFNKR